MPSGRLCAEQNRTVRKFYGDFARFYSDTERRGGFEFEILDINIQMRLLFCNFLYFRLKNLQIHRPRQIEQKCHIYAKNRKKRQQSEYFPKIFHISSTNLVNFNKIIPPVRGFLQGFLKLLSYVNSIYKIYQLFYKKILYINIESKTGKKREKMGVNTNYEVKINEVKYPQTLNARTETPVAPINLNGNGNLGQVGDGFVRSTDSTLDEAEKLIDSNNLDQLKSAEQRVSALSVEDTDPVKDAQAAEDAAAANVTDRQSAADAADANKDAAETENDAAKENEETATQNKAAAAQAQSAATENHTQAQANTQQATADVTKAEANQAQAEAAAKADPTNAAAQTRAAQAKTKTTEAKQKETVAKKEEATAKENKDNADKQADKAEKEEKKAKTIAKKAASGLSKATQTASQLGSLLTMAKSALGTAQNNTADYTTTTGETKAQVQQRLAATIKSLENGGSGNPYSSYSTTSGFTLSNATSSAAGSAYNAVSSASTNVAANSANFASAAGSNAATPNIFLKKA